MLTWISLVSRFRLSKTSLTVCVWLHRQVHIAEVCFNSRISFVICWHPCFIIRTTKHKLLCRSVAVMWNSGEKVLLTVLHTHHSPTPHAHICILKIMHYNLKFIFAVTLGWNYAGSQKMQHVDFALIQWSRNRETLEGLTYTMRRGHFS